MVDAIWNAKAPTYVHLEDFAACNLRNAVKNAEKSLRSPTTAAMESGSFLKKRAALEEQRRRREVERTAAAVHIQAATRRLLAIRHASCRRSDGRAHNHILAERRQLWLHDRRAMRMFGYPVHMLPRAIVDKAASRYPWVREREKRDEVTTRSRPDFFLKSLRCPSDGDMTATTSSERSQPSSFSSNHATPAP